VAPELIDSFNPGMCTEVLRYRAEDPRAGENCASPLCFDPPSRALEVSSGVLDLEHLAKLWKSYAQLLNITEGSDSVCTCLYPITFITLLGDDEPGRNRDLYLDRRDQFGFIVICEGLWPFVCVLRSAFRVLRSAFCGQHQHSARSVSIPWASGMNANPLNVFCLRRSPFCVLGSASAFT
jgi:hypothetical protein